MEANENPQKIPKIFSCFFCDYITSNKKDYAKHLLTPKHLKANFMLTKANENPQKSPNLFHCEKCNIVLKHKSSYCRHKKRCNLNEPSDKELIIMLLKQNSQLIEQNSEMVKNGINNTNSHNINSHNKTFNLQFFLNETCKDAMNIMDFVESIQLQLSDLENVGKVGYVEGISNIITSNLKRLDITQRPVHCTDKKREILYIKDENKWEKEDEEKQKLKKAIKRVVSKNQRLLLKFKEVYPDCRKSSSPLSDQYNKIIIEACGGPGDNDIEKENKIIKNISSATTINKEIS